MIFKELFAIFKKDTLLDRAYQRSYEMVDLTSSKPEFTSAAPATAK